MLSKLRTHLGCQTAEMGGLICAAGAMLEKRSALCGTWLLAGAELAKMAMDDCPMAEWHKPQVVQWLPS